MSVYRPSSGSAWWVDLVLPRVGRVKKNTGTHDRREAVRREGMLRDLCDDAQDELLRALAAGIVSVADLVNAKRAGKLSGNHALTDVKLRAPLFGAIDDTLTEKTVPGAETLRRYQTSVEALRRADTECSLLCVGDLIAFNWPELRKEWGKSPADWNHLRRMLSRFLSLYLGDKYHPIRRQFMQLMPQANEGNGRISTLSLERFRQMLAKVPPHTVPVYMTLLLTAMRRKEYWSSGKAHLRPDLLAVQVPGTKTKGSAALVAVDATQWDWIEKGIPAPIGYQRARIWWSEAAKAIGVPGIRIHDIRHLALSLSLEGGAKVNETQRHARHATPQQTLQYTQLDDSRNAAAGIARALTAGTTGE